MNADSADSAIQIKMSKRNPENKYRWWKSILPINGVSRPSWFPLHSIKRSIIRATPTAEVILIIIDAPAPLDLSSQTFTNFEFPSRWTVNPFFSLLYPTTLLPFPWYWSGIASPTKYLCLCFHFSISDFSSWSKTYNISRSHQSCF